MTCDATPLDSDVVFTGHAMCFLFLMCDMYLFTVHLDTEHKVDDVEFAPNEVYAIDIVVSSGDGRNNTR